jgi:hypothetical protein
MPSEADQALENRMTGVFGTFIILVVVFVLIGVGGYFIGGELFADTPKSKFLLEKAAVIFGLPIAALVAYLVVALLKQADGNPIKFTVGQASFEGVSGQVVLWFLCFLGIAGAIKLLW